MESWFLSRNTWGLLDREITSRTGESVQWCEFEFGGHGVCVLSKQELNFYTQRLIGHIYERKYIRHLIHSLNSR